MRWRLAMAIGLAALAASGGTAQTYDDRPTKAVPANYGFNYDRRVVEVPMRDGTKLHTVILTPKGATDAPILLTRTPYNAEALTTNRKSGDLATALYGYDNATDVIVDGGIALIFNTTEGWQSLKESQSIRASALVAKVPYYTTAAASAGSPSPSRPIPPCAARASTSTWSRPTAISAAIA